MPLIKMTNVKISAILFDWDSTLASVMGDVPGSHLIAALFERRNLHYSADEIQKAIETRQEKVKQGKLPGTLEIQTRRDVALFYKQILTVLGFRDANLTLGKQLYGEFGYLPSVLYKDTLPVLRSLSQMGFTLGIISNNTSSARTNIQTRVSEFIQPKHILISEDIGIHKPAKTIFKRGASIVGVHPKNCVYVGDRLRVDAIGAVQQGNYGYGLWLDRKRVGSSNDLPERVFRITSLHEVVDFIKKYS
jgi:FMN phosphatase YigB (HAD superfamily)